MFFFSLCINSLALLSNRDRSGGENKCKYHLMFISMWACMSACGKEKDMEKVTWYLSEM